MSPVRRRITPIVAALLVAAAFCPAGADGPPEAVNNYFTLHTLYLKWSGALFGSRHYHERQLNSFLVRLIGKEITTEHDFMLTSPEGVVDKTVACIFRNERWLYVHGELDEESLKLLSRSGYESLKSWWRSGEFVALSGKVKYFKLDHDERGEDIVHLFFEKIRVLK
jgi:hypothetical protein